MPFRPTHEKQEERERVRAALLRAALRLGAQHGFASLGLREVAREAGIAPTSFYRHFSDMAELGRALVRELAGGLLRELGERAVSPAALVDSALSCAERDPELLRFVISERLGAFEGLRALLRAELAVLTHVLHGALSRGLPDPQALPPVAAEIIVALLLDGCAKVLDGAPAGAGSVRDGLLWGITRVLGTERPS